MVALSLVLFTLIYGVLMVVDVYLLSRTGKQGPGDDESTEDDTEPVLVTA